MSSFNCHSSLGLESCMDVNPQRPAFSRPPFEPMTRILFRSALINDAPIPAAPTRAQISSDCPLVQLLLPSLRSNEITRSPSCGSPYFCFPRPASTANHPVPGLIRSLPPIKQNQLHHLAVLMPSLVGGGTGECGTSEMQKVNGEC